MPANSALKSFGTYVALAFLCSWAVWAPVVLLFRDVTAPPLWALLLAFAGIYGPSIAAIATAWRRGGRPELNAFLRRSSRWRVRWWWYAVVLCGPPTFVWAGAILESLLGSQLHTKGLQSFITVAAVLLTFLPFGPLGEELGWRGYALPHLEARFSPFVSSLILGIVWAAWHAPMFWIPPVGLPARTASSVALWIANILSFSILLSYVARRTQYSVPIAILFHAALNAGPRMGMAVFAASQSVLQRVDRLALLLRWLTTLAAAVALIREGRRIRSQHDTADSGMAR